MIVCTSYGFVHSCVAPFPMQNALRNCSILFIAEKDHFPEMLQLNRMHNVAVVSMILSQKAVGL